LKLRGFHFDWVFVLLQGQESKRKTWNAFTFIPPPPSYTVENEDEMHYLMEGLEAAELYRKASEASEMHWLTTRTGNYVPMVWLRREKIVTEREVRDEAINCSGRSCCIAMATRRILG
ncbi:unnamed protein product, partial [Durusdinium trenchii]